jgi:hypothetical protein
VLQKGQRVGEYTVVRKLGEGQFAEVWEVKDSAGARVSGSLDSRACMCGQGLGRSAVMHPNGEAIRFHAHLQQAGACRGGCRARQRPASVHGRRRQASLCLVL